MTSHQSASTRAQEPVRIILADDHPVVLLGTRMALKKMKSLTLCISAEATSPADLLLLLEREPCDLLITDYSMPTCRQPDGLALIGYIRRTYKETKIIVMTMTKNKLLIQHLLATGVRGVFDKLRPLEELSDAVTSVLKGGCYLSPSFENAPENISKDMPKKIQLTVKEYEVKRLLSAGLTGREIAKRLNRSEKTISRQKRSAMLKEGIRNTTEMIEAKQAFKLQQLHKSK